MKQVPVVYIAGVPFTQEEVIEINEDLARIESTEQLDTEEPHVLEEMDT